MESYVDVEPPHLWKVSGPMESCVDVEPSHMAVRDSLVHSVYRPAVVRICPAPLPVHWPVATNATLFFKKVNSLSDQYFNFSYQIS